MKDFKEEYFIDQHGAHYTKKLNSQKQVVYAKTNCNGVKNSGSTPISGSEYRRVRKQPTTSVPKSL